MDVKSLKSNTEPPPHVQHPPPRHLTTLCLPQLAPKTASQDAITTCPVPGGICWQSYQRRGSPAQRDPQRPLQTPGGNRPGQAGKANTVLSATAQHRHQGITTSSPSHVPITGTSLPGEHWQHSQTQAQDPPRRVAYQGDICILR